MQQVNGDAPWLNGGRCAAIDAAQRRNPRVDAYLLACAAFSMNAATAFACDM